VGCFWSGNVNGCLRTVCQWGVVDLEAEGWNQGKSLQGAYGWIFRLVVDKGEGKKTSE